MRKATDNTTRRALRVAAAAQYLSVSPRAIRTLVQTGELPLIKICEGDRSPWLLDIRDLDSLVERKKVSLL
jgi:excisionase family DNA binding protein